MNYRFNDFLTKTQLLDQDLFANILIIVIQKSMFGNFTFYLLLLSMCVFLIIFFSCFLANLKIISYRSEEIPEDKDILTFPQSQLSVLRDRKFDLGHITLIHM